MTSVRVSACYRHVRESWSWLTKGPRGSRMCDGQPPSLAGSSPWAVFTATHHENGRAPIKDGSMRNGFGVSNAAHSGCARIRGQSILCKSSCEHSAMSVLTTISPSSWVNVQG